MNVKEFILSGDNFSNLNEFYTEVQRVLTDDFQGFGRDLDAFDDILYGGFNRFHGNEKITLIWKNADKSKQDLGYAETVRYLEETLDECHPSNKKDIERRLELAKQGKGPTMFDALIKIIKRHRTIRLIIQ